MQFNIQDCVCAPDKRQMDGLLGEYYGLMASRITALGGSVPAGGKQATAEFWDEIDHFLPPLGRLFLVRNEDEDLFGCGSLKSLTPLKGELKRLFVKSEVRGSGVGHKLVELIIEAARTMGLKTLYADTLKNNFEVRGLFKKTGFTEIDFYPESATYKMLPELRPLMSFYKIDL